jgi:hypothetical protein
VLTHTAPAQGLFDRAGGSRAIWQMPRTSPPSVYLTHDDRPNAATTPMLLDVLAREHVHVTLFLIDRKITNGTQYPCWRACSPMSGPRLSADPAPLRPDACARATVDGDGQVDMLPRGATNVRERDPPEEPATVGNANRDGDVAQHAGANADVGTVNPGRPGCAPCRILLVAPGVIAGGRVPRWWKTLRMPAAPDPGIWMNWKNQPG